MKLQFQITAVELSFQEWDVTLTACICTVLLYVKRIWKKGLPTTGLVSMLKQAPAAASNALGPAVQLSTKNNRRQVAATHATHAHPVGLTRFSCSTVTETWPSEAQLQILEKSSQWTQCVCLQSIPGFLSSPNAPAPHLYPAFSTTCSSYSYPSCLTLQVLLHFPISLIQSISSAFPSSSSLPCFLAF